MADPAESELHGDVGPETAGGVVRYRVWPARRHRLRATVATLAGALLVGGAAWAFDSLLWPLFVAAGALLALALLFLPAEVTLDGKNLHLGQLGMLRTWDLREFCSMEVARQPLPRVELHHGNRRAGLLRRMDWVTVPLPDASDEAEQVLRHLRRWVARKPTGRFELDADYAPEDNL